LAIGAAAIVLLIGTFTIVPLYTIPVTTTFDLQVLGDNQTMVNPGEVAIFAAVINNTGTVNITIEMSVSQVPFGWSAILYPSGSSPDGGTNSLSQPVIYNQNATVEMQVQLPDSALPGQYTLFLNSDTSDTKNVKTFNIVVS